LKPARGQPVGDREAENRRADQDEQRDSGDAPRRMNGEPSYTR